MFEKNFVTPTDLAQVTGQRPQAVYNLIKMGYIKATDVTCEYDCTHRIITNEEATRYATSYLEKKANKLAKSE